jgi:serine/threonine-protein kinase HipA
MSRRELVALINDDLVGVFGEENDQWAFEYAQSWLNQAECFALSPHLPLQTEPHRDGSSQRQVQWYFDNLLPEEGQRVLLAKDASIDTADAFGLLAYYGAESAGSLTLLPGEDREQKVSELRRLSHQQLSERIQQLPKVSLNHSAIKRMSLAGAQRKLAVVLQDDELFEPAGATPSTHILKPNHPDVDYPHSVVNEYFAMRLAGKLGLEVPEVRRLYVPEPVYLIDRFDRFVSNNEWHRKHVIDACQLLGLDRNFKYAQGSVQTLEKLANACRSPAVARTRLFSWLVFNILIGNSDAHLKNLSFLVSEEGIQLAPHYDLLSVAVYDSPSFDKSGWPEQTRLTWAIQGRKTFAELSRSTMLEVGETLRLARATTARLLDFQLERIESAAQSLYEQIQTENEELARIQPNLGPTFAGEARCLRAVQHLVIRKMVASIEKP